MQAVLMTCSYAKVSGQRSVGSEDGVETNGRTDRRTDEGDFITSLANAVCKYHLPHYLANPHLRAFVLPQHACVAIVTAVTTTTVAMTTDLVHPFSQQNVIPTDSFTRF